MPQWCAFREVRVWVGGVLVSWRVGLGPQGWNAPKVCIMATSLYCHRVPSRSTHCWTMEAKQGHVVQTSSCVLMARGLFGHWGPLDRPTAQHHKARRCLRDRPAKGASATSKSICTSWATAGTWCAPRKASCMPTPPPKLSSSPTAIHPPPQNSRTRRARARTPAPTPTSVRPRPREPAHAPQAKSPAVLRLCSHNPV